MIPEVPWEAAFCISLARSPERWEFALGEFDREKLVVEKFPATDWKTLDSDLGKGFTKKVPTDHNPLAHMACGISHFRLISLALSRGYESVAIFEDDVQLMPNFKRMVHESARDLPESWPFFYLGYRKMRGDSVSPYAQSRRVVTVHRCYETHAYVVTRKTMEMIRKRWNPHKTTSDWFFNTLPLRYGAEPVVADQNKLLPSEIDPQTGGLL